MFLPRARARLARTAPLAAALVLAVVGSTLVAGPAVAAVPTPRGALDQIEVHGDVVTVDGWAWAGVAGPTEVHLYDQARGFVPIGKLSTSVARPDVAAGVPGAPADAGFQGEFTLPDGAHRVCAYAIGANNPLIGCRDASTKKLTSRDVTVGALDTVVRDGPGIRVRGWVWDPQAVEDLDTLTVTDETGGTVEVLASGQDGLPRPDVNRAFPGAFLTTGYDVPVRSVEQGDRRICVTAGAEGEPTVRLGCKVVSGVGDPVGVVDDISSAYKGHLSVRGWAFEWNYSPMTVHVYDNGRILAVLPVNGYRSDVTAAYPGTRPENGFNLLKFDMAKGVHQICVYAINVPAGNNPNLGCRTVTVGR